MVRIKPLPGALNGAAFRTTEAARLGASAGRIRAADLVAPMRGIRLPAEHVSSLEHRCRAVLAHRPSRIAFSHATAALLLGAPLPRRLEECALLHVCVPAGERAPQIKGIRSHTRSTWTDAYVRGLPVTSPEQTWLDLVPSLDHASSVALADFLVSGPEPWSTRAQLEEAVAHGSGRRGVKEARAQLAAIRTGVDSPGETRLRLLLTGTGLPEPAVNFTLLSRDGTTLARADLAYPGEQVALEYEGDIHRIDRQVWMKDIRRRERLEDAGWRLVRVTASDLHNPAELLRRLRKLLARREKS